ncbi:MAG: efflux RND transporter periplasmic adaptor subunit [Nitrospiraceae bacterium]
MKLRSDLIVSQQEMPEGASLVIKDPATGRFFRFKKPEYFIAQQLDGSTPLDSIRERVEKQFGAPFPQETLEQFIHRLRLLGLLEAEGAELGHLAQRRGRVRGSLLYLRLKAFDPNRLFDRLLPKVHLFFTPSFVALSAFLIFLALAITISNAGEIGRDLLSLYRFEALLLAWLIVILVTAAHEFAHGLTCKRFGGDVHEMGFMLLFFMPAFYCNVSDAWLFPQKSKRLWVTFAGAYFEIFLWALATVIWRLTDPGTALSYVALIVMATSGIKTLFNLNPLIKLDGYYLLSDALDIPNLRQRAFAYLGARIKRLWGSAIQGIKDVTPRERRIYLTYGLLAGVYSFSLLGFIFMRFGGFLIERYQGTGLILFSALLMGVFGNPLRKVFPRAGGPAKSGPGRNRSMKKLAKFLTAAAAILAILFFGRMELKVSGEFTVLPDHNADVRAQVKGIIAEVYADEGDRVKAGDLIARLSARDYRAELRKTAAAIAEKRANLKMLKAGPRREEIELAREEVDTAKTRLEHARKRHEEAKQMRVERLAKAESTVAKGEERLKYARSQRDIYQTLYKRELIAWLELEKAREEVAVRAKELEEAGAELKLVLADDLAEVRTAFAVAEKELEETEGRLRVLLAGSRAEEIEAAEAEIARLEVERRHLEEQIQLTRIVSPTSGVVTTPKLKEKIGQHLEKGDLIAEVHELKTVRAEIAIPEKEIGDVKVGQQIILKARAYPQRTFYGKGISIAPIAIKQEDGRGGRMVLVTTELDNASLLLKPEMTGNAKIYCGKRRILDLVTRRLARYVRVEFWSWW